MKPALKFLRYFEPNIFILGGDNWNGGCISRWNYDNYPNIGMDNVARMFRDESTAFREYVEEIIDYLPDGCRAVYLIGNHEDWLEQFCRKFPQLNKPTMQSILGGLDIKFVRQGQFFKVGHLNFCHGDNFGTMNPAKKGVTDCKASIIMGHHHTFKVWSDHSMVDDTRKYLGVCAPCFCNRAPDYGKNKPNAWLTGFVTAHVKKSGNFNHHVQLVSPKGNFIDQMGKEWM